MCLKIGESKRPMLGGQLWGSMLYSIAVSLEGPCSCYFILLLLEELEHIWEFVQFEKEQT